MQRYKLIKSIALLILFLSIALSVYADCTSFSSYTPNNRITLTKSMANNWESLGWLVGMRCDDLIKLRLDIIEEYRKTSRDISISTIQQEINNLATELSNRENELQIINNQKDPVKFRLILEATYVAMSKALVIISCFSPDPFTKMQCPYAVKTFIDSCISIYDTMAELNRLSSMADAAAKRCNYLINRLYSLQSQLNEQMSTQGLELYREISDNLCEIIKTYCDSTTNSGVTGIPVVAPSLLRITN